MKLFAPALLVCAIAFSGFTFEAPVLTDGGSSVITSCESEASVVYLETVRDEVSSFLPQIRAASGLRSTSRVTEVFTGALRRAMTIYQRALRACK